MKFGCGKPIFVHYFAPLNESSPDSTIDYAT